MHEVGGVDQTMKKVDIEFVVIHEGMIAFTDSGIPYRGIEVKTEGNRQTLRVIEKYFQGFHTEERKNR